MKRGVRPMSYGSLSGIREQLQEARSYSERVRESIVEIRKMAEKGSVSDDIGPRPVRKVVDNYT